MARDGRFDGAELGSRLETELVAQHRTGLLGGAERVGLAPVAVKRAKQDAPAAFAQRVLVDEPLGVGDVAAPFGRRLLGRQLQLHEPGPLAGGGKPVVELGPWFAAPHRQRSVSISPREPFEQCRVGREEQPIPVRLGRDGIGAETLTKSDHVVLQ